MIYVSYAELARDVISWSHQLPRDIDVVAGVPRSGIIPATIFALHRNVQLTTVDELRDGRIMHGGKRNTHKRALKCMVMDDSILSGNAIEEAKAKLLHVSGMQIIYGAVYLQPGLEYMHYKKLPTPRLFEWNWLHHYWLSKACVDIDGVLCEDPSPADNDDGPSYRNFLLHATPKNIPTVMIHTLVTNRLEKYRQQTVIWLRRHGIKYGKLLMHPARSKQERQRIGDHATRKAKVYTNKEYKLFIESSDRQAQIISARTQKPVLCTDTGEFFA